MATPTPPTTIAEMEDGSLYGDTIHKKPYRKELRNLQIELLKLQRWVIDSGQRLVLVFEGRDAAGKGGSIKRFTEHLNPRGARIAALPKPSDVEQTQWYFQRYISHLPHGGEIVFFDRSWYNRAGVETVMGFCTPREHAEFLRQAPWFEESLVASGTHLFKLWFTVSQEEQRARFESRKDDPLRRWKLSPIDEASIDRYDDYTKARNQMLSYTDRPGTPWTVINSNDKKRARIGSIRHVLSSLDYPGKDATVAARPDPAVVRPAADIGIPVDLAD